MEGDYVSEADLEAAWKSFGDARQAAVVRSGSMELKRRADVTATAESEALHRFIEAPAEGPRGVFAFIRSEPEWAQQALLDYFERGQAGDKSEESVKRWRDERAEAEAAHLAV